MPWTFLQGMFVSRPAVGSSLLISESTKASVLWRPSRCCVSCHPDDVAGSAHLVAGYSSSPVCIVIFQSPPTIE